LPLPTSILTSGLLSKKRFSWPLLCPSHCDFLLFISPTRSRGLYNFPYSWLVLILQTICTVTVLYTLIASLT
jgi:hypothetical protein